MTCPAGLTSGFGRQKTGVGPLQSGVPTGAAVADTFVVARSFVTKLLFPELSARPRRGEPLLKTGMAADAQVIQAQRTTWRRGNPPSHYQWRLTARVDAAEGPFDAELKDYFRNFREPVPGTILHVLYDPSNHRSIVVDHRSDADRAAGIGQPSDDPPITPEEISARMGGDVQQMTVSPGVTGMRVLVVGKGGKAAKADPISALGELADRHDRGEIGDEEYETGKRRLLGE
jgi:hypothetical protein